METLTNSDLVVFARVEWSLPSLCIVPIIFCNEPSAELTICFLFTPSDTCPEHMNGHIADNVAWTILMIVSVSYCFPYMKYVCMCNIYLCVCHHTVDTCYVNIRPSEIGRSTYLTLREELLRMSLLSLHEYNEIEVETLKIHWTTEKPVE